MALTDQISSAMTRIATEIKTRGLPTGGTTGQVLKKTSSTDFAASWQTQTNVLVLAVGDAVPGGTPDGTVIVRYTP